MTTRLNDSGVREYLALDGEWHLVAPSVRRARGEGESVDRARTRKNNEILAAGRHPATRLRLLPHPEGLSPRTCGECLHHVAVGHSRTYHKCDVSRLGISASAASDIRLKWPACELFEERSA